LSEESQEVTRQFGKHGGGIELALASVVFGLLGLWIDSKMGTTPILFIGFFIFGFLGSAFSVYYLFKEEMAAHDAVNERRSLGDSSNLHTLIDEDQ